MIGIGKITKIVDKEKLTVEFQSLTGGKDILAYPLDVSSVPEVGEFIIFVVLPDGVGQSIVYSRLRSCTESNTVEFKSGSNTISVSSDSIQLKNKKYTLKVTETGVEISGLTPLRSTGLEILPGSTGIKAPNGACVVEPGVLVCPSTSTVTFS